MARWYTISDFNKQFPNEDACLDFLFRKGHGSHSVCRRCQSIGKYYRVKGRRCFECGRCGHQIYPTKGTIFEKSRTPLISWFNIIFDFCKSRNGVSAMEIARTIGVTYKTAWRMGHQIRKMMKENVGLLKGIVEMDESQMGGRRNKNKNYVFGMVERNGKIKTVVVKDRPNGEELIPIIRKCVEKGTVTYTDKYGGYVKLTNEGYLHKSISHKKAFAFKNGVSTNRIEGFWSLFKRSITGTHVHISRKWMQSYLDEYAFRYNRRNGIDFIELVLARFKK